MKVPLAGVGEKTQTSIPLPITSVPPSSRPKRRRSLLFILALVLLFSTSKCWSSHRHAHVGRNPAYLIQAEHGAVATENKRCSDIGVSMLKDGGNAVDAGISATLCIGVVNMFSYASFLSLDHDLSLHKVGDRWRRLHDRSLTGKVHQRVI